jgi:hypothetical protein
MRSSIDGEARGQFDDILAVQLAKARFAVSADSGSREIYPGSYSHSTRCARTWHSALILLCVLLIRKAIRRVPLELPAGVFTESGVLDRELRVGARYPEVTWWSD